MSDPRQPLLVLHVLWHPDSAYGQVAEALRAHFARARFSGVTGRMGMSVMFRRVGAGGGLPAPVDFDGSQATVVTVLAGDEMAAHDGWKRYVTDTMARTTDDRLRHRVLPVTVTRSGLDVAGGLQAIRWDRWEGDDAERQSRLVFELTLELLVARVISLATSWELSGI